MQAWLHFFTEDWDFPSYKMAAGFYFGEILGCQLSPPFLLSCCLLWSLAKVWLFWDNRFLLFHSSALGFLFLNSHSPAPLLLSISISFWKVFTPTFHFSTSPRTASTFWLTLELCASPAASSSWLFLRAFRQNSSTHSCLPSSCSGLGSTAGEKHPAFWTYVVQICFCATGAISMPWNSRFPGQHDPSASIVFIKIPFLHSPQTFHLAPLYFCLTSVLGWRCLPLHKSIEARWECLQFPVTPPITSPVPSPVPTFPYLTSLPEPRLLPSWASLDVSLQ